MNLWHWNENCVDSKVPAEEATLDASVSEANLTFQHLSRASQLSFKEKVEWFHKQCDVLRVPWDVEHQHLKVCEEAFVLIGQMGWGEKKRDLFALYLGRFSV